jgi:uncharacterized SAM-dependent methyltransferase
VPAADLDFTLRAGERVWTESSYKYTAADVDQMLQRSGFTVAAQWHDAAAGFALTLAV